MAFILFIFKKNKFNFLSGVDFYRHNHFPESSIFLTANRFNCEFPCVVLPFWDSPDSIKMNDKIRNEISSYDNVVLGISSPKQDMLADLIINEFPNKNVYCLGAAIYSKKAVKSLSTIKLTWLAFLITDFNRTVNKLLLTIKNIIDIIFKPSHRLMFRDFINLLNKDIQI